MREVGAEYTHPRPGQACKVSCSWLWLFAVGLRGCLFDPFFFVVRKEGLLQLPTFAQHVYQEPQMESGENTPF